MREVEVEVSWKDTPVSTTVTLMMYWTMTPFCWSAGGELQVMAAEREVDALPVKPSGLALGTKMYMHNQTHSNDKLLLIFLFMYSTYECVPSSGVVIRITDV